MGKLHSFKIFNLFGKGIIKHFFAVCEGKKCGRDVTPCCYLVFFKKTDYFVDLGKTKNQNLKKVKKNTENFRFDAFLVREAGLEPARPQ